MCACGVCMWCVHVCVCMHVCACVCVQGRRQDFCFGGANLAAKGSPAGSTVPGIARGSGGMLPRKNLRF